MQRDRMIFNITRNRYEHAKKTGLFLGKGDDGSIYPEIEIYQRPSLSIPLTSIDNDQVLAQRCFFYYLLPGTINLCATVCSLLNMCSPVTITCII